MTNLVRNTQFFLSLKELKTSHAKQSSVSFSYFRWQGIGSYRYGFQNQEHDNELWSGAVSYKYRVEDPRLGRFFSVDPLAAKYPHNSVYAFSENRVIDGVELEGLEVILVNGWDGLSHETKSNKNPQDLSTMQGYWTNKNSTFVEGIKSYFNQGEAIYIDGSQGGPTHGDALVRYANGYGLAIDMMNSGEIDICNVTCNITLIGHSQGGAFATGMAEAIQKRINDEGIVGLDVNLLLLAPDGAEQFSAPVQVNTLQLTYGDDGVVTDNKATVGNVDLDANPMREKHNPFETWSLERAMEAHSAPIDEPKRLENILIYNPQAKELFKNK
jgi:RHS repeat-associated protein